MSPERNEIEREPARRGKISERNFELKSLLGRGGGGGGSALKLMGANSPLKFYMPLSNLLVIAVFGLKQKSFLCLREVFLDVDKISYLILPLVFL